MNCPNCNSTSVTDDFCGSCGAYVASLLFEIKQKKALILARARESLDSHDIDSCLKYLLEYLQD